MDLTSARPKVDEGALAVSSVILSEAKDFSKVVASRIIICVTVLLRVPHFARNDTAYDFRPCSINSIS